MKIYVYLWVIVMIGLFKWSGLCCLWGISWGWRNKWSTDYDWLCCVSAVKVYLLSVSPFTVSLWWSVANLLRRKGGILTYSVFFWKVFMNLPCRNSNRANTPAVLHAAYISQHFIFWYGLVAVLGIYECICNVLRIFYREVNLLRSQA